MARYLMEHDGEVRRLEVKTQEELSHRLLEGAGVAPGMRVLDAGAGSGAVTRTIAERVGATGLAVALDASHPRLAEGHHAAPDAGHVCCAASLLAPPFRGAFDLVWSRFVFEYLPDPIAAARSLLACLRPGGRLVVGDTDGHGLWHHPVPPAVAEGLPHLQRGLEGAFDPWMGRKLYHVLREAGAHDVSVAVHPYHLYAGVAGPEDLENWEAKLRVIREQVAPAFPSFEAYDRFAAAYLDMLRDPEVFSYSTLIVAQGRRAA